MFTSKYLTHGKGAFRRLLKSSPSISTGIGAGTNISKCPQSCRLFSSKLQESYSNIIVTKHDPAQPIKEGHLSVGLIELNRPKALNALSDSLFDDLIHATTSLNEMDDIGSIVITGKGKAFAAGADIAEMSEKEFSDVYKKVRL
jgi:hypothetical protein